MAYKNLVPIVFERPVSKKVILSFSFEEYVDKEQAAEAISRFIAEEYGGKIPTAWIKLENPILFAAKYDDE